ncbi:MAG: hypothetical protein QOE83_336 [Actinomycetota bacterium]|jgi:hypothetical protein|nr:hypothetical protein [Actinomycetota bacterium]
MPAHGDSAGRSEFYLAWIRAQALSAHLRGLPGNWADVARVAAKVESTLLPGPECDVVGHRHAVELHFWKLVARGAVRPERLPELAAAIHRAHLLHGGGGEARLRLTCPGLDHAVDDELGQPADKELRLLALLRSFIAAPSARKLSEAARLAIPPGGACSDGFVHDCKLEGVLEAVFVVTTALLEVMPPPVYLAITGRAFEAMHATLMPGQPLQRELAQIQTGPKNSLLSCSLFGYLAWGAMGEMVTEGSANEEWLILGSNEWAEAALPRTSSVSGSEV